MQVSILLGGLGHDASTRFSTAACALQVVRCESGAVRNWMPNPMASNAAKRPENCVVVTVVVCDEVAEVVGVDVGVVVGVVVCEVVGVVVLEVVRVVVAVVVRVEV